MSDHRLHDEPLPEGRPRGRPPQPNGGPLVANLVAIAARDLDPDTGWTPWARMATHSTWESARVLASMLRNGRKATEGRPAGAWEFEARRITEGDDAGKSGVWARWKP